MGFPRGCAGRRVTQSYPHQASWIPPSPVHPLPPKCSTPHPRGLGAQLVLQGDQVPPRGLGGTQS